MANLDARSTEQGAGRLGLPGGEEDAVTGIGAHLGRESGALFLREVLSDRSAQFAILTDQHVCQAAGAALLGPLLPGVEQIGRASCRERAEMEGGAVGLRERQ